MPNPDARAMKLQFALTGTSMSTVIEALKAEFTEDTLSQIAHAINADNDDREDLRSEIEGYLVDETGGQPLPNTEALERLTDYFSDTAFSVEMFADMKFNSASALLHMYSVIALTINDKSREAHA